MSDALPDLTVCDREPVHVPGSIQPHGLLLALSGPGLTVVHRSANATGMIRGGDPLGRPLAEVSPELDALLRRDADGAHDPHGARFVATLRLDGPAGPASYDAVVHGSGSLTVLELERVPERSATLETLYPTLRAFVERIHEAPDVEGLCRLAAADVRRITGFDRVLVYRFDRDWNGTVIAEERNERLPSYLDLRFPASDIPAQARDLYRRNRLRIIPDAGYAPVPVEPAASPATGEPLDMSHATLRSVSPVHVEYMRNMGTMASMSISILRDGELWGLISCHSADPRQVPLQVRNACDFIGRILSLQLAVRERALEAEERVALGSVQARLLGYMAEEESFVDGLVGHPENFLKLAGAGGAAVISGDHCFLVGETPSRDEVAALCAWLARSRPDEVFATETLGASFPAAKSYADRASGLLAVSISKAHASYVLWFRPEVVRTVRWAGDPRKPVEERDGAMRIHPRRSFEAWKETVRGRSLPWRPAEIETAKELRNAVVGIVLRRAEELASVTEELKRSNKELEAFSYSVSHDLRAPFRHIVGYSELLKKAEGDKLTERGRRYLDTIIESALTAGTLVDNLLSFSQMGRAALKPRLVDMNVLVAEVRQKLALDIGDRRIQWRIGDLASVRADPIMLRLAVENLVSNAVKYTRSRAEAVIEIGSRRVGDEVVFHVRDNGVGFDMAYVNKLFGVFQRLHKMEDFEGTGIGLANVRRIVERHGGRAWGEGAVDRGATFFFSLPDPKGAR